MVAWHVGDNFIAILSALAVGSTIGFLLMNYPKEKLFLGDGVLISWVSEIAILTLARNSTVNAWQILLIFTYFVIEVLFSIYSRKFIKNAHADLSTHIAKNN